VTTIAVFTEDRRSYAAGICNDFERELTTLALFFSANFDG